MRTNRRRRDQAQTTKNRSQPQSAERKRALAAILELTKKAQDGDIDALNDLIELYRNGARDSAGNIIVATNAKAADRYELRAARLGDPISMTAVAGRLARRGATTQAVKLYRAAFLQGYETAAYNLAALYQSLCRYTDAVKWYRKALSAGDESALLEIGRAELYGIGAKRNTSSGIARLRRLAASKATYWPPFWIQQEAMIELAYAHMNGWLTRRDYRKGVEWLRRAAKLGSAVAESALKALNGADF